MDVQAPQRREGEGPRTEDPPVGDDHEDVRAGSGEAGEGRLSLQALRLPEREAEGAGPCGDGRVLGSRVAADGTGGLGDDEDHVVPRIPEGIQRGKCEGGRPEEGDAHGFQSSGRAPMIEKSSIIRENRD